MADFHSWKFENLVKFAEEASAENALLRADNVALKADLRFAMTQIRKQMQQDVTANPDR